MGPLDTPEEAGGISFESLFFQELVAMNDYLGLGYKIYYWKTSNNIEVDFVLYGDRGLKIFEVKRKGKILGSDLRGLKDEDNYVREQAAAALGKIGDKRAVEPLIEALKDENGHVRSGAANALGKIRDKRAVKPIIEVLKDKYSDVRWSAAD
ncbi:unnamed protein product, partial [marine sediment metagenome]